ncbi:MAG: hypothetical protein ACTSR4_04880 [Candidatus Hodarchaeales archaeon]
MATAGKIIAVISGILTFLGTFVFSLLTIGPIVNYGVGGVINLIPLFQVASGWGVMEWVFVIGYIIFLLSFILQLIGIKSRIAALFGSLLPIAVVVVVFLGYFGVWDFWTYLMVLSGEGLVTTWFPMTFGFGLEFPAIPGLMIDLGTFIVGTGGILSLVSVFLTRED